MLTRRIAPIAALAAVLALPLSLVVAAPASAATVNVDTWDELKAAMLVGGDTISLTGDITNVVGENLTVESGESVTLDLNGFTLSITDPGNDKAAVNVPVAATLTINATGGGTLTATGGSEGAGIGGGDGGAGGTVTLNGGTINATGGDAGAGIGGGKFGAGGTVIINGGIITATGGRYGAGVGGGFQGLGGTLTIHGTPDAGNATTGASGGTFDAGKGADPINNPTMPPGVGYSAVTSLVGNVGVEGGRIVVVFNYLVTFDATGGSSTNTQKVNEGGTAAEPADPTRTGYEFAGWRVGDKAYDFSTPVTDPVTLTATWTEVLAPTGAEQGLFLPVALTLLLLGGILLTVGRTRRA